MYRRGITPKSCLYHSKTGLKNINLSLNDTKSENQSDTQTVSLVITKRNDWLEKISDKLSLLDWDLIECKCLYVW